ncbi:MAG: VOC family protein [Sphingomonadaceae bacterium]|nr:VOC family protein [Sphingomonadaceae bacterium]
MLNYATVGSNDLPAAIAFYEALLGSVGWQKAFDHASGGRIWRDASGSIFAVLAPLNGEPATVGNGTMIGFALESPDAVAAFHAKGMELGGKDEGAPGNRGSEEAPFYFGYFRDLDGNKLCGFHIPPR